MTNTMTPPVSLEKNYDVTIVAVPADRTLDPTMVMDWQCGPWNLRKATSMINRFKANRELLPNLRWHAVIVNRGAEQ
jgi:hypothetical protein